MRAIVLHNPDAGNGDVAADELLAALAGGGVTAVRYCSTRQPDFAQALGEPADLIVVAGGDGTVIKVVPHLRGRTLPIAILPLGGANNVARSLGITGDPLEIARGGWQGSDRRRLDIGAARGPWGRRLFIEAVGLGALAEAAAAIDKSGVSGPDKSELARRALCETVAAAQPQEVRLTIDGQEVGLRCLLAEIMNLAATGPKLLLAPAADPGDGLLDLVYLEPEARADMLAWLEAPAEGVPPLVTRRGRGFTFEWRQGQLRVGDTFPSPPASPCTVAVELLPEAVTVLAPRAPIPGGIE